MSLAPCSEDHYQNEGDGANSAIVSAHEQNSNARLLQCPIEETAANNNHISSGARKTQQETCVICLEGITERAITVPCNHWTFDFLCLVSWLQEHSTCPLCKAEVSELQYDWGGVDDFSTYRVTPTASGRTKWALSTLVSSNTRAASLSEPAYRRQRPSTRHRHARGAAHASSSISRDAQTTDAAVSRRRQVYRKNLYSLHVGSSPYTHYREFTAATFNSSAELQSRARAFIRRELQVFDFSSPSSIVRNREALLNYIIAILRRSDIKDSAGRAEDSLAEFLGRDSARLFLHELRAWLRSNYRTLPEWDQAVQYESSLT